MPLQWLKAYSPGCIIVCPLTDDSWAPSLERLQEELFSSVLEGSEASMVAIGVSRAGGMRHADEEDIQALAESTGCPIVAVHESRFIEKEDAFAYEVAEAIRSGYKLNDPVRPENRYKDAYLPEES